ncbi:MAG: ribosome recycling factor [Bacteroidetes bacterium]|nr:ribosome recycling factor [Bacteroidota bacterium]
MNEEVAFYLDSAKESMQQAYEHLEYELTKIRAGKASPDMLAGLKVEYYGMATPINQVASIKTTDAKTLVVIPFEKGILQDIERSIFQANLGFTPQNDGESIRIILPPTTEERRRSLAKNVKAHGEDAKVSLRNARKEANDGIKELVKDGLSEDLGKTAEHNIQDLTDSFTAKIDKLVAAKEKEVMTV